MDPSENGPAPHGDVSLYDPDLPPRQQVLGLFYAKWTLGALRAVVELRVPDVLAEGPRTVAEIAAETGADADLLSRVLRAVAATGALEERADDSFALTPLTAGLVTGAPDGIRDMFLFASDPMLWRPYEHVAHTVRTGETAFQHSFGMTFYEYLKAHPAKAALFDRAMLQNRYPATDRIFAGYDFGRFRRIADVGGGKGQFLAEILRRHPGCTGVLVDQPQTVADAKETFEAAGLADRVTIAPSDFFTEVSAGCDAYFIKHTLHNWDDRKAALLLRSVRTAIGADRNARLLIVDQLLHGPGAWDIGKLIDIEAMSVIGGRERDRREWDRIAALADFAPTGDPRPGSLALLEYRPI
ncbi:methyltransferase [Actinomadura sp. 9N407]|uniref:methyltransferase n=1 Tax=Actinomadura sp. 9N407 TaxID=3375154 RepID=UPI0037A26C65